MAGMWVKLEVPASAGMTTRDKKREIPAPGPESE